MVYRDLFGRDLTEYEIQVLTNNGVGDEAWARAAEQMEMHRAFHDSRGARGKLRRILKAAGIAASALGPLIRTFAKPWSTPNKTPDTADERTPKRLRSQPNLLKNAQALKEMSSKDDEDMQLAADLVKGGELSSARAASSGASTAVGRGNQETPIYNQVAHYGMPNTTTVVLPWTNYYTIVTPPNNGASNVGVELRLNSVYDIFPQSTNTATAGANITEGRYTKKYIGNGTWPNPLLEYPKSSQADGTSEYPQWRAVWDKLYSYYTVLGCHFKITIHNPRNLLKHDCVVAWGMDSFSVANGGINYPGGRKLSEMEYWPGLQWKVVKSYNNGEDDETYQVIEGYYKPGMINRNVQNDEDVKTWTAVGALPILTERLRMFFGNAAFNTSNDSVGVGIKVQMKYIVQYKDLVLNVMYPASGQTAFNVAFPTDVLTAV